LGKLRGVFWIVNRVGGVSAEIAYVMAAGQGALEGFLGSEGGMITSDKDFHS
jgi:hypothetical protein